MNFETLVMRVVNSLKINDNYKANIVVLENFIKEKEEMTSLTEEQCISLSKAKSQIEILKNIISKHELEIKTLLKDKNLESVMEVAKIIKDDFKI